MKFKFCGNIDCPEWLISEITLLTKISSIKIRIICNNLISTIINDKELKDVKKTLEEMNFTEEDALIIISLLEFILKNSAKFDVEDIVLNQELQQLGLPQENAESISKVFKNQKENLKGKLKTNIFTFNKAENIDYKISYVLANSYTDFDVKMIKSDEFSLDYTEKESYKITNLEAKINLALNINNEREYHFNLNKEMLGKLLSDLEKSKEIIQKYKENN